jgi:hypothetical protein
LRAVLSLAGGVVPWEIAERLKPHQLLAFQIIAGELKGGEFDWKAMQWKKARS